MSRQHQDYFASLPPMSSARLEEFTAEAARSLQSQQSMEASETEPFESFLARYFATPGV